MQRPSRTRLTIREQDVIVEYVVHPAEPDVGIHSEWPEWTLCDTVTGEVHDLDDKITLEEEDYIADKLMEDHNDKKYSREDTFDDDLDKT